MKFPSLFAIFVIFLLTISTATAFSTIGLSNVDFKSNDPELNTKAYVLTVVENGNEQYAVGTFTPAQMKANDGTTPTKNLKIEITNTENSCNYDFTNQYVPVSNVQISEVSIWTGQADCEALPGSFWIVRNPSRYTSYCFIKTTTAQVTPLSTSSTLITSKITATVDSEVVSGYVTNTAQRSVQLGNRVFAQWQGNLVSGEQCPQPLDSGVYGVKYDGKFLITDYQNFLRYNSAESELIGCFGNVGAFQGYDAYKACVDTYNNKANAVLLKTSNTKFKNAAVADGQAKITLSNLLQYPVITMHVQADWLGIFIPVGKPSIVSLTSNPFKEGSNGTIRATIKNVGDGKGAFNVYATCSGTMQTGTSKTLSLLPGESNFVDLPLTCNTNAASESGSCTVIAEDINKPTNKDSKNVNTACQAIAICSPGQERCENNKVIQQCNSDGSQWTDKETCPNGCNVDSSGKPICQNVESCSTASDCDDNDPTTADTCVGVPGFKHCQHSNIPEFDWAKWGKLIGFGLATIIFGIAAIFLFKAGQPLWGSISAVLGVIGLIGSIIGIFAMMSTTAAIFGVTGVVLLLAGVALIQFVPSAGLVAIVLGVIGIIVSVAIVVIL